MTRRSRSSDENGIQSESGIEIEIEILDVDFGIGRGAAMPPPARWAMDASPAASRSRLRGALVAAPIAAAIALVVAAVVVISNNNRNHRTGEREGVLAVIDHVADGLLVVPTDQAIGALAYWTDEHGVRPLADRDASRATPLDVHGDVVALTPDRQHIALYDIRNDTIVRRFNANYGPGPNLLGGCFSPDGRYLAIRLAHARYAIIVDVGSGQVQASFVTSALMRWSADTTLLHTVSTAAGKTTLSEFDLRDGRDHSVTADLDTPASICGY